MRQIIDARGDIERLRKIFITELSGYWKEHISFDVVSSRVPSTLSKRSIDILLVNLVVPLYYAYGRHCVDHQVEDMAMDLLSQIDAETNSIVTQWSNLGIKADNALRSQALIHLKNQYCDTRKCLYCRIGNQMLRVAGKK